MNNNQYINEYLKEGLKEEGVDEEVKKEDDFDIKTEMQYNLMVDVLNAFMKYYNKKHETNTNIFHGLNLTQDNSTNDQMEILYKELHEYNKLEGSDKLIKEVKDEEKKYKHVLTISVGEMSKQYGCDNLIPLLIQTNKFDENINWTIE